SPLRVAWRATVPRKQSACSASRASWPPGCTTRRSRRDSPWEPDVETSSYRYCGVCGQPLEPGATVCGNCGAPVDGATDGTPPTGEQPMAMPAAAAAAGGAAGGAAGAGAAGGGGGRGVPPGDDDDDEGMSSGMKWLIAALIVLAIILAGVVIALVVSG